MSLQRALTGTSCCSAIQNSKRTQSLLTPYHDPAYACMQEVILQCGVEISLAGQPTSSPCRSGLARETRCKQGRTSAILHAYILAARYALGVNLGKCTCMYAYKMSEVLGMQLLWPHRAHLPNTCEALLIVLSSYYKGSYFHCYF